MLYVASSRKETQDSEIAIKKDRQKRGRGAYDFLSPTRMENTKNGVGSKLNDKLRAR